MTHANKFYDIIFLLPWLQRDKIKTIVKVFIFKPIQLKLKRGFTRDYFSFTQTKLRFVTVLQTDQLGDYFGPYTLKIASSNVSLLNNNALPSQFMSLNLTLQNGETAIMLAARRGHNEVCKLLVQEGADLIEKDDVSP